MPQTISASPDFDIIVVGGGIGGLTTAIRSIELGKRVLVIEKLEKTGGSAGMSAGILWTAPSESVLREILPNGNQELCRIVVSEYENVRNYVARTGVSMSEEWHDHLGWGRACKIDIAALIQLWTDTIRTEGELLLGVRDVAVASPTAAAADAPAPYSVSYTTAAGERITRSAASIVLATGGMQGDPLLRQTFIGTPADTIAVRSNAGSVGDGFRLGTELGGGASTHLGAFYGHTLPSPLEVTEALALRMTLYFSNRGIVINRNGRRFSNEGLGDEVTTQRLVHQQGQRGVLIWDDEAHQQHALAAPYPSGMVLDRHSEAQALGARTAEADTLDELLDILAEWDMDVATAHTTIDHYRRAASGERVPLDAPISAEPATLASAPYRAIELQPCITLPFGGLSVDEFGRLLNRDGLPVPGAYAIGGDAGGMQDLRYVGGIIFAMVYGIRAAEFAANSLD